MHTTTYKDREFIGTKSHHAVLHEWYDNLAESEVKAMIVKIKCREFKPYDPTSFQLVVLCNHPFIEESFAIDRAKQSGNEAAVDRAVGALLKAFASWVSFRGMPDETCLDNRHAVVNWWPVEMLPYGFDDLPPQMKAQMEMNYHAMDCLELIRIATASPDEFLKRWEGSNDPFLAAGRLASGGFEWIRQFPGNFIGSESTRDSLPERIGEFARDYLGLCRYASISGHKSLLTKKISITLGRFQKQYPSRIPGWLLLAQLHLDGVIDTSISSAILSPEEYDEIDGVCELLRSNLVEATDGLEDLIPPMINSFLPTLKVPESAHFFTNDLDGYPEQTG